MAGQTQSLDEFATGRASTLDAATDDGASSPGQHPFRELEIRVGLERWVENPLHRFAPGQKIEHRRRVLHVPLHP
jgi:hypothetical protein